jgi:hypothetical protein
MRNEYKFRTFICLLFGAIAPILSPVFAQNNHLTIGWRDAASAPRFLNVCGDAQTVTAVVRTEGVSSTTRANVTATVQLFKGIRLMQFNAFDGGRDVDRQFKSKSPCFQVAEFGSK